MKEVIVYKTKFCPYCVAAVQFLSSKGISFKEVSLESDPDLRVKLSQENGGWRTVPMIFAGDHFIGGYTELVSAHKSGNLEKLLS